jgi:hypothetical protein
LTNFFIGITAVPYGMFSFLIKKGGKMTNEIREYRVSRALAKKEKKVVGEISTLWSGCGLEPRIVRKKTGLLLSRPALNIASLSV